MRVAGRLEETLQRAALRTAGYAFKDWGFGEAIAMLGLLAAAGATGERRHRNVVTSLFERWWSQRGGRLTWEDHVTPGVPLLLLARDDQQWLPAARALGELYQRFPRQAGVPVHRPDLDAWAAHVWVDCLYTDGAFLTLLARMIGERIAGEGSWEDMACECTLAYVRVLWDEPSGLFFHGYDTATGRANEIRWGRGNGWALLGLVDMLRFLRADHPARPRLETIVRRQIDALVALQDRSGHWHTVLDRPETYLETSVAAMLTWAIPQAVRLGVVADTALTAAAAAFEAALSATDADGNLTGVSEATPAGSLELYATRPTGVFPWGQGPLLLAVADRIAPDRLWEGLP